MELAPIALTLRLASITTLLLLFLGTPIAWWLARTQRRIKVIVEACVALPLVLPPTVLGFYLLLALGPQGWVGSTWQNLTGAALTFTFSGLVIASMLYSLPFVVQPLQNTFGQVGDKLLETAACLRATRRDMFFSLVLPLSTRGYITAAVLVFAHTLGEFGIVLMVGGNIPGKTQVLSIVIYDHVESLDYATAHILSASLLAFSFVVLTVVYTLNRRSAVRAA